MKRWKGWLGLLSAVLLGMVASAGAVIGLAPIASRLWMLPAVGVIAAVLVATLVAVPSSRHARVPPRRGSVVASLLAVLPILALMAAIHLAPTRVTPARVADPRGPHATIRLPTGSTLAVWPRPSSARKHATPVVFLHGGPGGYVLTRDLEIGAAFRQVGFDTVYFDQAGSGASADLPIAAYSVARSVADLDALRARLGAKRLVLWGQSWGASLAAAYVQAHPDRVAAVIADSPGDYPGHASVFDYSSSDQVSPFEPTPRDAVLYLLISHAPQLAGQWMTQADHHGYVDAIGRGTSRRGYQCRGAPPLVPFVTSGGGSLYTNRRLLLDIDAQTRIAGPISTVPTLILRGACDYIEPATAQRYRRAFPASTFHAVPGMGHGFFGHDATLQAALEDFATTRMSSVP